LAGIAYIRIYCRLKSSAFLTVFYYISRPACGMLLTGVFLPDAQGNQGRNFIPGDVHTQNIVENVITLFYI
jgi:hypothetical protein